MTNFKFTNIDLNNRKKRKPATPADAKKTYLGDIRFRQLLGREAWNKLPVAVRRRFDTRVGHGESKIYKGYIAYTHMNTLGLVLAQLLRIIGAPLPIDKSNTGQAAVVTVTEDAEGHGQFWTRQYGRKAGFPQVIHSSKRFAGPTGLEEYVGAGIGMTLHLAVERKVLLFKHTRYFLTLFGRRIYLPKWLEPGALIVSHTDRGKGDDGHWFEFGLELTHPVFGRLFDQRVMFKDTEA